MLEKVKWHAVFFAFTILWGKYTYIIISYGLVHIGIINSIMYALITYSLLSVRLGRKYHDDE